MTITKNIPCLVCGNPITVKPARGRKSGKSFIMLVCGEDGRHFRGFVTDQNYIKKIHGSLEASA